MYFVVETSLVDDNRKLKSLTPDKDGFYKGIPLCGLGMVTRNNTFYDTDSLIEKITDENSTFNKRLKTGDLFGEYGHPYVPNLNSEEGMQRIMTLLPDRKTIFFKKIYSKKIEDLNMNFVFGDIKPAGPYGQYSEELLIDPNMNFSTSLRAITSNKMINNISNRKVLLLITFDAGVPGGGYKEASKRYRDISSEDLCEILSPEQFLNLKKDTSIAFESLLTETELNDILKCSRISVEGKISGYFINNENLIYDESEGKKRNILSVLL